MLARLHEERDLQRRASIYRFPQQFHAMGPLVGEFLAQAFGTQVNHKPLQLRGAYLHQRHAGRQPDRPRAGGAGAQLQAGARAAVAGPAAPARASSSRACCARWCSRRPSLAELDRRPPATARGLVRLFDPGHLDRLEDLLAAALRVVVEPGQRQHPVAQIDEVDRLRDPGRGNFSASAIAISRESVHFICSRRLRVRS